MYSLIIRNGSVADPEQGQIFPADVAVEDGMIAKVEPEIEGAAVCETDAAGCLVTPGLIDHHAHIWPLAKIGIPGEAVCFASGVTTAVDAGSTGWISYRKHRPVLSAMKLEVKSYINVCSFGLDSLPESMEDVAPEHMEGERLKELFEEFPGELLGLKLRTSRNIVGDRGFEPLAEAVRLGTSLSRPVMVHITDPPGPLKELFERLRPGDIVTHMYQNKGYDILENGTVSGAAKTARERGILFEAADARAHFSFEVAEAAMREQFYPDFIGTDLTKLSMHLRPTAFNMAMQISKYAFLGMGFLEAVRRATINPAVSMGIADRVGSVREGKQADLAVFFPWSRKNVFGDRPFGDRDCVLREGNLVYVPVMTVKKGEMVYRSNAF